MILGSILHIKVQLKLVLRKHGKNGKIAGLMNTCFMKITIIVLIPIGSMYGIYDSFTYMKG